MSIKISPCDVGIVGFLVTTEKNRAPCHLKRNSLTHNATECYGRSSTSTLEHVREITAKKFRSIDSQETLSSRLVFDPVHAQLQLTLLVAT